MSLSLKYIPSYVVNIKDYVKDYTKKTDRKQELKNMCFKEKISSDN